MIHVFSPTPTAVYLLAKPLAAPITKPFKCANSIQEEPSLILPSFLLLLTFAIQIIFEPKSEIDLLKVYLPLRMYRLWL